MLSFSAWLHDYSFQSMPFDCFQCLAKFQQNTKHQTENTLRKKHNQTILCGSVMCLSRLLLLANITDSYEYMNISLIVTTGADHASAMRFCVLDIEGFWVGFSMCVSSTIHNTVIWHKNRQYQDFLGDYWWLFFQNFTLAVKTKEPCDILLVASHSNKCNLLFGGVMADSHP